MVVDADLGAVAAVLVVVAAARGVLLVNAAEAGDEEKARCLAQDAKDVFLEQCGAIRDEIPRRAAIVKFDRVPLVLVMAMYV